MNDNSQPVGIKSILARRLLIYIVAFSTVITFMAAGLQIYRDFARDKASISATIQQIATSDLPSIINSLWVSDEELLRIHLTNILALPNISYLEIDRPTGKSISVGTPVGPEAIQKSFPLFHTFRGRDVDLGTLRIEASLEGVYENILRRVVFILQAEAVKIFLISFFVLLIFYLLVGRHLTAMAAYANSLDLTRLDLPLILQRRPMRKNKRDELDMVVSSLNDMRLSLQSDIARRKRVEEDLRSSNTLLNAVMAGTTDAVFIKDLEGRYLLANSATLLAIGKTEQEVLGKDDSQFFPPESAARIRDIDQSIIDSGEIRVNEEELVTSYGNTIWLSSKSPYRDKDGNIQGIIGISRNITERKRAEEEKISLQAQLKQAQKMEAIGTLAGGIAHDFNNLLVPIISYTEMVMENLSPDSQERQDLGEVRKAANRAKELVRHILAFSRMDQEEEWRPFLVVPLVRETLKLLKASLPSNIRIDQNIGVQKSTVCANPTQVQQVLMNLCTNAFHAMAKSGGTLTVSLAETDLDQEEGRQVGLGEGRYLLLTVEDTGTGMDKVTRERVFEPYFSTKELGRGTGLGLSVVHGIVKGCGGAIRVTSEPGQGSVFTVYLPLQADMVHEEQRPLPQPVQLGSEHILLVDDEAAIVESTRRILEKNGYRVTAMISSKEALAAFRAAPETFDLVLTDQTMPEMTGDQLARELMTIRNDIPVILVTGYSSVIDEFKADQLGIKDFLLKPVDKNDLLQAIRRVLDAR